jgi:hypothetical protein
MPKDVMAGRDPQIEKAIQVGLDEIKKNTPVRPIKPKYRCTRDLRKAYAARFLEPRSAAG